MGLTKFNGDANNIQGLADKPTQSASALKALFDKIGSDLKAYINGTLTTEIDTALSGKANSNNVYSKNEANNLLETKAPTDHASSSSTYGLGTTSNYGHCKVLQSTDISEINDGEALGAYQGYYLKNLINDKQKTISSGTATPSGGSDGDIYIQYF